MIFRLALSSEGGGALTIVITTTPSVQNDIYIYIPALGEWERLPYGGHSIEKPIESENRDKFPVHFAHCYHPLSPTLAPFSSRLGTSCESHPRCCSCHRSRRSRPPLSQLNQRLDGALHGSSLRKAPVSVSVLSRWKPLWFSHKVWNGFHDLSFYRHRRYLPETLHAKLRPVCPHSGVMTDRRNGQEVDLSLKHVRSWGTVFGIRIEGLAPRNPVDRLRRRGKGPACADRCTYCTVFSQVLS